MHQHEAEAMRLNKLSECIIGACISIHKALGPGLQESIYEECLCHELDLQGIKYERQYPLPVVYKGIHLECGYRLDLLVEGLIIVEIKAQTQLLPVHQAQLLTYLKLADVRLGLLVNFHVRVMRDGIKRVVNDFPEPSIRYCPGVDVGTKK